MNRFSDFLFLFPPRVSYTGGRNSLVCVSPKRACCRPMDTSQPSPQQTLERKEFEPFLFAGLILSLVLALVSSLYDFAAGSADKSPPRIVIVVPRADRLYEFGTALDFDAVDRGGSGVESVTGLLADSERNFVQSVLSGFVSEPGVD